MGLLTASSNSFVDRVFVITGSSRGIGKELARQVLEAGGRVVLNSRTPAALTAAQDELSSLFDGRHIRSFAGDVSQADQARKLIDYAITEFGRIDVLINNAAMSNYGTIGAGDPAVFKTVIDVNIYGVLFPTWYAVPHLSNQHGRIMIVSSLAGLHGLPRNSAYSLSKMALTAFAESLQSELHGMNVSVGIAYVGFTENEAAKRRYGPDGELEEMPRRKGVKTTTRKQTARRILSQIERRKFRAVHSNLGLLMYYLNRLSPGLVDFVLARNKKLRQ
jgi:NAD(P)-dependent dehydrogenase (short-subunit alcohol dehydrogenase family)